MKPSPHKLLIRLRPGWSEVLPKPSKRHGIIVRTPGGNQHLLSCVEVVTDAETLRDWGRSKVAAE